MQLACLRLFLLELIHLLDEQYAVAHPLLEEWLLGSRSLELLQQPRVQLRLALQRPRSEDRVLVLLSHAYTRTSLGHQVDEACHVLKAEYHLAVERRQWLLFQKFVNHLDVAHLRGCLARGKLPLSLFDFEFFFN